MSTFLPVLAAASVLLVLTLCTAVLICVWVYRDAKARGLEAWVWTLVVLLSSGVGLIIYFLVGRKEARKACPRCGGHIPAGSAYCPCCGAAQLPEETGSVRGGGMGPLIGAAVCLALTVALGVGLVVFMAAPEGGGWRPSFSTVYVENSWGDQWNVSWHYTNSTSTHSFKLTEDGPRTLYFEGGSGEGPLILRVWQGETEKTFDLSGEGGGGSLDLGIFAPGRVHLELWNDNGGGKNVHFASHWE